MMIIILQILFTCLFVFLSFLFVLSSAVQRGSKCHYSTIPNPSPPKKNKDRKQNKSKHKAISVHDSSTAEITILIKIICSIFFSPRECIRGNSHIASVPVNWKNYNQAVVYSSFTFCEGMH